MFFNIAFNLKRAHFEIFVSGGKDDSAEAIALRLMKTDVFWGF